MKLLHKHNIAVVLIFFLAPILAWLGLHRETDDRISAVTDERPYGENTLFIVAESGNARIQVMPDRDLVMLSVPAVKGRAESIWKKQDAPRKILQIVDGRTEKGWGTSVRLPPAVVGVSKYKFYTYPKLEVDCMNTLFSMNCWDWEDSPFEKERQAALSREK